MKKIMLAVIAVTMLFTACNSTAEHHDFRNIDFGMSSIELLDIEGEPDIDFPAESSDDVALYDYFYREAFGVENATISYYVDINGVGSAYAAYTNKHPDNKSYLIEYQTIKENLIADWGKPTEVSESEDDFNYLCSWGTKFLELYRNEDDSVKLQVRAYRPDYYDSYLERQQTVTESVTE